MSKPRIDLEQFRQLLARECKSAGSQKAFADMHALSSAYVSDVIHGRRDPGDAMCFAVGLRRVLLFEQRS